MKKEFLVENSLYTDKTSYDELIRNKEAVSNAFWINILGTFGLFGISSKRGLMKNHFQEDGKPQLASIADDNKDVSLVIKLMYEVGGIQSSVVNELSRFFMSVKSRKITDKNFDENQFRQILDKINVQKTRPHIMVLNIVNQFIDGEKNSKQVGKMMYELVKSRKKEFMHLSSEFYSMARQYLIYFKDIDVNAFNLNTTATPTAPLSIVKTASAPLSPRAPRPSKPMSFTMDVPLELEPIPNAPLIQQYDSLQYSLIAANMWANESDSDVLVQLKNTYGLEKEDIAEHLLPKEMDRAIWMSITNISDIEYFLTQTELGKFVATLPGGIAKVVLINQTIPSRSVDLVVDVLERFAPEIKKLSRTETFLGMRFDEVIKMVGFKTKFERWFLENMKTALFSDFKRFINIGDGKLGWDLDPKSTWSHDNTYVGNNINLGLHYMGVYDRNIIKDILNRISGIVWDEEEKNITGWGGILEEHIVEGKFRDDASLAASVPLIKFGSMSASGMTVLLDAWSMPSVFSRKVSVETARATINGAAFGMELLKRIGSGLTSDPEVFNTMTVNLFSDESQDRNTPDHNKFMTELTNYLINHIIDNKIKIAKTNPGLKYFFERTNTRDALSNNGSLVAIRKLWHYLVKMHPSLLTSSEFSQLETYRSIGMDQSEQIESFLRYVKPSKRALAKLAESKFGKHAFNVPELLKPFLDISETYYEKLNYILEWELELEDFFSQDELRKYVEENKQLISGLKKEKIQKIFELAGQELKDSLTQSVLSKDSLTGDVDYELLVQAISFEEGKELFSKFSVEKILSISEPDFINVIKYSSEEQFLKLLETDEYRLGGLIIRDVATVLNLSEEGQKILGTKSLMEIINRWYGMAANSRSISNQLTVLWESIVSNLPPEEYTKMYDSLPDGIKRQFYESTINAFCLKDFSADLMSADNPIKPNFKLAPNQIQEVLQYNDLVNEPPPFVEHKPITELARKYQIPNIQQLNISVEDGVDYDLRTIEYDVFNSGEHGKLAPQFIRSFNVDIPLQQEMGLSWLEKFTKEYDRLPRTMKGVFHGTGSIGASMILRYGFKILKPGASGVVGRMLGDGIYFSTVIDKVSQYLGDDGFGRNIGTVGYIFEMDAMLGVRGVHYEAASDPEEPETYSYDLVSPEWCVFDGNSQLRIKKAHMVKLMPRININKMKEQRGLTEENEMKITSFKDYITEDVDVKGKNCMTYIFRDGNLPTKQGIKDFSKVKKADIPSNAKIDWTGAGPAILIYGGDKTECRVIANTELFVHGKNDVYQEFANLMRF